MEQLDRYLQIALEEYQPEQGAKQAVWSCLKKETECQAIDKESSLYYPVTELQQVFRFAFSNLCYFGKDAWKGKKNFIVIL